MELLNKIYTTEGRLNRLSFLKYQVIWTLISAVVVFILAFIGGFLSGDPQSVLVTVPTGIWSFISGIGSIMISIRRLHDLNKSGWWLLLFLIPLVDIFFLVYIFVIPGTGGRNRYGADPSQNFLVLQ
ncbi:MAG: DUF805 domain-containing protein [Selenomonadaceae bacterium]|nr:DUF805 domain-containing protein [Selenomonadaceae bacterium]